MSMEANRIDTYTEISGQEIRFVARSCCGWRWCFVSRASISYLPSLSLSFCVSFLFRRRTFQFSSGTLKTLCNTLIRPIYTSRYPPAPGIETHPNRRSQLFVHHPNFGIKKKSLQIVTWIYPPDAPDLRYIVYFDTTRLLRFVPASFLFWFYYLTPLTPSLTPSLIPSPPHPPSSRRFHHKGFRWDNMEMLSSALPITATRCCLDRSWLAPPWFLY